MRVEAAVALVSETYNRINKTRNTNCYDCLAGISSGKQTHATQYLSLYLYKNMLLGALSLCVTLNSSGIAVTYKAIRYSCNIPMLHRPNYCYLITNSDPLQVMITK